MAHYVSLIGSNGVIQTREVVNGTVTFNPHPPEGAYTVIAYEGARAAAGLGQP
jgi:hypothetical protein